MAALKDSGLGQQDDQGGGSRLLCLAPKDCAKEALLGKRVSKLVSFCFFVTKETVWKFQKMEKCGLLIRLKGKVEVDGLLILMMKMMRFA